MRLGMKIEWNFTDAMCICENVMKWKGSSPKEEEKKGVVN